MFKLSARLSRQQNGRLAQYGLAALLTLGSPLSGRSEGLPDLGDASQEVISPQQERQIGQQSMFQIRADKHFLADAEVGDYLNQLGYRLAANSSEPSLEFEFFALNDNAINAFALPGGFIGVNTGLMLAAQTESELASVLSHEIAHVTQHHLARMVAGQKYDSLASMAAMAFAILAARSNPQAAQAAAVGVTAGTMQRRLNFTREHEEEADRIGLEILQKSGFDTRAMPAFFERLQKATRLLDGNAPSYLRTHPMTNDRIADIAGRVQQLPYKLVPDSLSFHLVRAKLIAQEKTPTEALAYFSDALGAHKFGDPTAQRYGLVLALLRLNQTAKANQEFAPLAKQAARNPMLTTLAGQLFRPEKSDAEHIAYYRTATQNFPQHRALVYDYAEWLLKAGHYPQALDLLTERIAAFPNDPRLYDYQARSYAALERPMELHRALAYAHVLRGQLYPAIEQLELAKRSGNDFYQLSAIDSDLKELHEIADAQKKR